VVVALVALPLCLGIALASEAPLLSGLITGIVGGLLVSWLSGSHTSVSGPAAGLAAVVIAQIGALGSFNIFLSAVIIAGVLQMLLGVMKAGSLAGFFPSSVIKGLLAAIGIILIMKQVPHLFGYNPDWVSQVNFQEGGTDSISGMLVNTFNIHPAATLVGVISVTLLWVWPHTPLKRLPLPAPLFVVLGAVGASMALRSLGEVWLINASHLVQVPIKDSLGELASALPRPEFAAMLRLDVWIAAITICIVASLETLLNLEAVDKLDKLKRSSPPNRELFAQGAGNIFSGFLGGLPITSVIVRSSVNVSSGGQTWMASFIHGILLILALVLFPQILNEIPLASLAAILIVTGFKLASPRLFVSMWRKGRSQFIPFILTILAIVLTDLLIGILIGLVTAIIFILYSNLSRPMNSSEIVDGNGNKLVRFELGSHVSFLNRATIHDGLATLPRHSMILIDARKTRYIDTDILNMLRDFERETAPARNITVSLVGFRDHYPLKDKQRFATTPTRVLQRQLSPDQVFERFQEGNRRFAQGRSVNSDLLHLQVRETAQSQYPLAVVLSCMDSRVGTEVVFDAGIGEAFSVKVAGNIVSRDGLGSIELGCLTAGAKLIIVLGHTGCSMIKAAVEMSHDDDACDHVGSITETIMSASGSWSYDDLMAEDDESVDLADPLSPEQLDQLSTQNVQQGMNTILTESYRILDKIEQGELKLVGGVYDVSTGQISWLPEGA